jgi:hypothetical protein
MDPHKYGQTMADMATKKESYPVWADMNFLERGNAGSSGDKQDVNQEILQLRKEILKLQTENAEFAAELEKAQNLLSLQRDIDKDNHLYYDEEKKRLSIMAKSVSLKAQELARRADEK